MSPADPKTSPNVSAARLNANRRNALRSTGPVTESGKARVRMNAWKHGFRAESDLIAADEADAIASRRTEWAAAFPVHSGDGYQGWLVDQLAASSVRIDRCQEHQRHQAVFERDRAASCWDFDRAADASRVGARLAKDPDRVVSTLMRTASGVDWLLARWRGLLDLLELGQGWADEHHRLCLDLMRSPAEFRASDLAMLRELPGDELLEFVREHLDDLDSIRESAARLDLSRRSLVEIGVPDSEGSDLARLHRYEAALWRRFRALERSYKGRRSLSPADPDDLDSDPIDDLITYSDRVSSGEEPPPASHFDALGLVSHAPAPRPERAPRRSPIEAPPSEAPPSRPSNPVRLPSAPSEPSDPPILQNRRARRAAAKKKQRHR